jgi:hypothetical protein
MSERTSVFVIPRYLANLNFWDIYSVGNSKTRKPGETNNKPQSSQKVGMIPAEVKCQRYEIVFLRKVKSGDIRVTLIPTCPTIGRPMILVVF